MYGEMGEKKKWLGKKLQKFTLQLLVLRKTRTKEGQDNRCNNTDLISHVHW